MLQSKFKIKVKYFFHFRILEFKDFLIKENLIKSKGDDEDEDDEDEDD